jgi:3-carboxy-cis,cis-muconate cycloisomerase
MLTTPAMSAAVGESAWLAAMIRFEAALARAEARAGLLSTELATSIESACEAIALDARTIGAAAAASATPAVPFVEALRAALPADSAAWVHFGTTSQDLLDTSMMLVALDALDVLDGSLEAFCAAAAGLAAAHADTVMLGRTLMQPAVPITFGLKTSGWLNAAMDARDALAGWRNKRLALQFGGAAGNLSALGVSGPAVAGYLAEELRLPLPELPWHTARGRVLALAAALVECAGVAAKTARDLVLLAQAEVGEISLAGAGKSSAMPHKRNPSGAIVVDACYRKASALGAMLLAGMAQEHERAAGGWQAEWSAVCELFELADAAVAGAAELLASLTVHPERMLENLDAQRGLPFSEGVAAQLSLTVGREIAREAVAAAVQRALARNSDFSDELASDPALSAAITAEQLNALFDLQRHLGASPQFIAAALQRYRSNEAG